MGRGMGVALLARVRRKVRVLLLRLLRLLSVNRTTLLPHAHEIYWESVL